jgi:hypothetical protein
MSISASIARFVGYYQRNGISATARRLGLALKRTLFSSRMVLFYCDIASQSPPANLPRSVTIERKTSQTSISPLDLQDIGNVWDRKLVQKNIKERFGLGASLWLIKWDGRLAGYGWTLRGRTVESHYLPLGADDVQFLDFHVFPKYRGRAMDWVLIERIVSELATEGVRRAYGEAAEWNKPSLSSFAMTSFRRLGLARKLTLFGRTIVCWTGEQDRSRQQSPLPAQVRTITKLLSMRGPE